MSIAFQSLYKVLHDLWSSDAFAERELQAYALPRIAHDSRHALVVVSAAMLLFLLTAMAMTASLGLNHQYIYTDALLSILALHVLLSTRRVRDTRQLHLLAACLLVFSGCASILVAQQIARIDMKFVLTTVALFVLIPLIPWRARHALCTVGAIYLMFTVSTALNHHRFTLSELWLFQFLLLFCAAISLVTVSRSQLIRDRDLATQFRLEIANSEMEEMCNRDFLTGARNRRYLEANFVTLAERHRYALQQSHFALLDIDHFKTINDRFGHETGDLALQAIEKAFRDVLTDADCLARIGGDEFAILLHGELAVQRVHAALSRISLQVMTDQGLHTLAVHCSAGIYTIENDLPLQFHEAYRQADMALYEAKRAGGNRVLSMADMQPHQQAS